MLIKNFITIMFCYQWWWNKVSYISCSGLKLMVGWRGRTLGPWKKPFH